jgi:peptide/nickel transport system substrate-binding protein
LNYASQMQLETPDPSTLVIKYDAPRISSFDALAGTFMGDPETLDQTRNGSAFVGTGPFRVKEWIQGDHLITVRNPDYWQSGKPYLDQVELRITPDLQSGVVSLEAGAVDWMSGVLGQDAQRLQTDPTYKMLLNGNGSSFFYLGLDVSVPALADKRVRQAMGYALDRQRLVDTALFGFGRPASILWPRQALAYDATQDQTYTYNLDRARQLLAAANWDPNTTINLMLNNAFPPTHSMGQIYQQDLAKIGIKVAIQTLEGAAFTPRLQKGEFGGAWMTSMGFMNQSPATFFLSAFPVRVPNASNFESPRYKGLIDQTYSEPDTQKLRSVLNELTQITLDEAFVVPVAESFSGATGIAVTRNSVQNIGWDNGGRFAYENIWLQQ